MNINDNKKLTETREKKYNPNVGSGFTDDRFGQGSIKVALTAEGIKAFVENAQVGGALLIKFNKETAYGNKHYFVELLPPFNSTNKAPKQAKTTKKAESALD